MACFAHKEKLTLHFRARSFRQADKSRNRLGKEGHARLKSEGFGVTWFLNWLNYLDTHDIFKNSAATSRRTPNLIG